MNKISWLIKRIGSKNPHPKGWGYTDEARGSTLRRSSGQALLTRALRGLRVYKNPHPKGWGYTDEARLRGLRVYKNPHPKGWGYTDEARLRGLRETADFFQPDLVLFNYNRENL